MCRRPKTIFGSKFFSSINVLVEMTALEKNAKIFKIGMLDLKPFLTMPLF